MCPGVQVSDAASRASDYNVDATDAASRSKHVRVCLSIMVFSGLSVCVFVHDSTSLSMCCSFHALIPLPRLCVALLMPLMPLPGLRVV